MGAGTSPADPAPAGRAADEPREPDEQDGAAESTESTGAAGPDPASDTGTATSTSVSTSTDTDEAGGRPRRSRRFPRFTRDTARPEGGGRAASGDAPAPARQWPVSYTHL
nr:hypothetical protein [Streptomyces sp. rh34]